jgi:16S rRNA (guanine527-N7)-methyltransferase
MTLTDGIAALGLRLPADAEDRLTAYLALLAKWNRTYNLSAIREPQQMVTHHLLDSLAVLPHLPTGTATLADVGSGAGLPGIPLAIVRPDLEVVSVEASQKKASFQQQARIELGLDNFRVHGGRVESLVLTASAAISRAFASLADFAAHAGHLAPRLLAMKGQYPAAELAQLPAGWHLEAAPRLEVPGLAAERHLIILGRN